jgi:hypothetical protein
LPAAHPRAEQFGDADLARARKQLEGFPGEQRARRAHREVEAAPGVLCHEPGGLREAHRGIELEAREARLADRQLAVGKAQHVADEDVALEQALDGQVLAERAGSERLVPGGDPGLRPHGLPERIVRDGIGVQRLGEAAVHRRVGLLVAFQAQRPHRDAPGSAALADGAEHRAAADVPGAGAGEVEAEKARHAGV